MAQFLPKFARETRENMDPSTSMEMDSMPTAVKFDATAQKELKDLLLDGHRSQEYVNNLVTFINHNSGRRRVAAAMLRDKKNVNAFIQEFQQTEFHKEGQTPRKIEAFNPEVSYKAKYKAARDAKKKAQAEVQAHSPHHERAVGYMQGYEDKRAGKPMRIPGLVPASGPNRTGGRAGASKAPGNG
jgi:hypothetical protein